MPQKGFLALPCELRQRVLLLTTPVIPYFDVNKEQVIQEMRDWVLTLKLVHSEVLADMEYVRKDWWNGHGAMWQKEMAHFKVKRARGCRALKITLYTHAVGEKKEAFTEGHAAFSELLRMHGLDETVLPTASFEVDDAYDKSLSVYLAII